MPGSRHPMARPACALVAASFALVAGAAPTAARAAAPIPGLGGPVLGMGATVVDRSAPATCTLIAQTGTGPATTLGTMKTTVRYQYAMPDFGISFVGAFLASARVTVPVTAEAKSKLDPLGDDLVTRLVDAALIGDRPADRFGLTGTAEVALPPAAGAFSVLSDAPPYVGLFGQGFVSDAAAVTIHPGPVKVEIAQNTPDSEAVAVGSANCVPDAPSTVFGTVTYRDAGPARTPNQVTGLNRRSTSAAGGTKLRVHLTGLAEDVTKVTIDGTPAPIVDTGSDYVEVTTPPHAVAENVRVAVTSTSGTSDDTVFDDFDYAAVATAAGSFDQSVVLLCGATDAAGVRVDQERMRLRMQLRGQLPVSVPSRGTVVATGVKATLAGGVEAGFGLPGDFNALGDVIDDVQVTSLALAATGATPTTMALIATPPAAYPRVQTWENNVPAWDVPAAGTLPASPAITATAAAGGKLELSIAALRLTALFRHWGNGLDQAQLTLDCAPQTTPAPLASVATTAQDRTPAVTRVLGSGQAGTGGAALITGARFTRTKAVRFGSKPATFFRVSGTGVIVASAPAQPAGTYDVRVTTTSGTSTVTTTSRYTYR